MYNEYSINYKAASEKAMDEIKSKLVAMIKTNGCISVHDVALVLQSERNIAVTPPYESEELGWDYNDISTFKVNKIANAYILTMVQPHAITKKA